MFPGSGQPETQKPAPGARVGGVGIGRVARSAVTLGSVDRLGLGRDVDRAGVAAGADGCIVEFHTCPEQALSDGPQALLPSDFLRMVEDVRRIHALLAEARPTYVWF